MCSIIEETRDALATVSCICKKISLPWMIVLLNEIGALYTPPEAIHRGDNKVAYKSGGGPPPVHYECALPKSTHATHAQS